jgi:hypothetical protein
MSDKGSDLSFIKKRELLFSAQTPPAALKMRGRELLEQGLFDDALEFFIKAQDHEGMEKILEECRRTGDAFTFEATLRALGRAAAREEWERMAQTALDSGQLWFAYRAFEKADNQAGLQKVREQMAGQRSKP